MDQLRLFRYLNREYRNSFDLELVPNTGEVPFVTGDLKQDAFLIYVREKYGIILSRENPKPDGFGKWLVTIIDEQKFSWLILKI